MSRTSLRPLAGKTVYILNDHDGPGRQYAADVVAKARLLNPRPRRLVIIDLNQFEGFEGIAPPMMLGEDVVNWLDRLPRDLGPDGQREILLRIAEAASQEGCGSPAWLKALLPKKLRPIEFGPTVVTIDPERYRGLIQRGAASTRTDEAGRWILDTLRSGPAPRRWPPVLGPHREGAGHRQGEAPRGQARQEPSQKTPLAFIGTVINQRWGY